jgi:hypothetical protein
MAKCAARMTMIEVMNDMRDCGFHISQKTLSDGMVAGVFPFGTLLSTGKTGRRTFMILRRDYEIWKNENMRRS